MMLKFNSKNLNPAILILAFKEQANTRFAPTVVRKRASDVGARFWNFFLSAGQVKSGDDCFGFIDAVKELNRLPTSLNMELNPFIFQLFF